MSTLKRKAGTQPDDPEQYRRFVEMAREVEADETLGAMDRAFERVIGRFSRKKQKPNEHE